jgi:hypothetical protein
MEGYVVFAVVVAAGLLIQTYRWWSGPRGRARRALGRIERVPIAELEHGVWAKVTGVVSPLERTLTSPIGQHACLGYRLEVEQMTGRTYPLVLELEECVAFSIADDTGRADVDGPFLLGVDFPSERLTVPRRSLGVLTGAGIETSGIFLERRFVYREALLRPGDRVSVMALVTVELDPTVRPEGFRSPPLAARLRGTVKQPIFIADSGGRVSR